MWQRSGCPIGVITSLCRGPDARWVMHFSVSIKSTLSHNESENAAVMQIKQQVVSSDGDVPVRFGSSGRTPLRLPPRGGVQILDQVPQDRKEPIWGSAGSLKSQTTGRRQFLCLHFRQQQEFGLKDNQTDSERSSIFNLLTAGGETILRSAHTKSVNFPRWNPAETRWSPADEAGRAAE